MNWREFFIPDKIKIILFLIIFMFAPFFIAERFPATFCTQSVPSECFDAPRNYEFSLHPLNTLMSITFAFGVITDFELIAMSVFIIIVKLIVSYIGSCIVVSLYRIHREPRSNSTPTGSPSKQSVRSANTDSTAAKY